MSVRFSTLKVNGEKKFLIFYKAQLCFVFFFSLLVVRKKAEVLCININRTAIIGTPLPFKTSPNKNKPSNEDTAKLRSKDKTSTGETPVPIRSEN
jgi:hypothetical protein